MVPQQEVESGGRETSKPVQIEGPLSDASRRKDLHTRDIRSDRNRSWLRPINSPPRYTLRFRGVIGVLSRVDSAREGINRCGNCSFFRTSFLNQQTLDPGRNHRSVDAAVDCRVSDSLTIPNLGS